MSLNHLIYPNIPDNERLNISVCDLHCCNVFSENPVIFQDIPQRIYEQLSPSVDVIQSDGEKSIIDTTGARGSTLFRANTVQTGSKYKLYSHGSIQTNGANKSFIIATKLGNAVLEAKQIILPNLNNGSFYTFNGEMLIYETGNAGTANLKSFFNFAFTDQQGVTENYFIDNTNATTFQTTADANFNITVEWLNNTTNILSCHSISLERIY